MSVPSLRFYARAKAVRLASVIRRYFAMQGLVGRGAEGALPSAHGESSPPSLLVTLSEWRDNRWVAVAFEPALAVDEGLGAFVSSELGCPVIVAVGGEPTAGLRRWEGGALVDRFDLVTGSVLTDVGEGWADRVAAAGSMASALAAAGVPEPGVVGAPARKVALAFEERVRAGAVLEVDPLLECPTCGGPMVARQSRRGGFYGCAAYPDCQGTLSEARAAQQRAASRW